MSHFNTYRVQVNCGNDLLLPQSTTILTCRLLHLPITRSLVVKTLLLLVVLSLSPLWSGAATWRIASLEWPPFAGSQLPEGGAGIAVLRAALKAEGIELQVEYFPWTRAILMSKRSVYAGLYPTWAEDVPPGFIPSVPIFKSPVGLVEPIREPVVWSRLEDLRGKTIGTVQDYGNTPEFMALIRSGEIKTQVVCRGTQICGTASYSGVRCSALSAHSNRLINIQGLPQSPLVGRLVECLLSGKVPGAV